MVEIRAARFPNDRATVLAIFTEYVHSPSVSLDFQGYEEEFADLPGKYAPPEGRLLLAAEGERVLGCVALRKVEDGVCEMKRLYVRPEARGIALGRRLAEAIVEEARSAGYAEMRLDVLPEFEAARRVYRSMGFVPADAVSHNPVPGTAFLGLDLRSDRSGRRIMPEESSGGCLCGAVRYRIQADAVARTLCHCTSCRRATGGVTVAWAVFPKSGVEVTRGRVREYSSSPGIHWGFCPDCGSLVTYRRDTRPEHTDITTATLDDPDRYPPTVEIWTGERIAWEQLNPGLPHKKRSSLNE